MKHIFLLGSLFFFTLSFSQGNKYWVRFKDKNNSAYSLSNPQQFLSQASIDRRIRQNIPLNETDLPISPAYLNGIAPFINGLNLTLKWSNTVVVDMSSAIIFHTDTMAWRDTVVMADTLSGTLNDSMTVYDSIFVHYQVVPDGNSYSFSTVTSNRFYTVRDTFAHPGPVYVRDTIYYTDVVTGNNFDSVLSLPFVDTIAAIRYNPYRAAHLQNKFEAEVPQVNQSIIYPNRYGAAYHQINMLNADLLHQMGFDGKGIAIAVMDNGFYNANNIAAYDIVRPHIMATWDFVNHEADVYNDGSHGENTFSCMAGNLPNKFIGTAPGADYYLFTTEDDNAEWVMEEYNWAAAAEVADSFGAQVFSTSLGYTEFDGGFGSHTYSDLTGHTAIITRAANMAFGKGILVLNSAGNEGQKPWYHIAAPADGDSVLAIGAVDSARNLAGFSSRGPNFVGRIKPDICAQGSNAAVITTGGVVGTNSGTSFSCPIMAGCAASLWSAFPEKSAREIYDAIVISADRFWSPNNDLGYGIPNFYNAYLLLKTNYNGGILRINDGAVIFPNPFTSELNISLYNKDLGSHKIEIFDAQGRKVYNKDFYVRNNTFEIVKLDAGILQQGNYFIRLDGEKNTARQLIKLK